MVSINPYRNNDDPQKDEDYNKPPPPKDNNENKEGGGVKTKAANASEKATSKIKSTAQNAVKSASSSATQLLFGSSRPGHSRSESEPGSKSLLDYAREAGQARDASSLKPKAEKQEDGSIKVGDYIIKDGQITLSEDALKNNPNLIPLELPDHLTANPQAKETEEQAANTQKLANDPKVNKLVSQRMMRGVEEFAKHASTLSNDKSTDGLNEREQAYLGYLKGESSQHPDQALVKGLLNASPEDKTGQLVPLSIMLANADPEKVDELKQGVSENLSDPSLSDAERLTALVDLANKTMSSEGKTQALARLVAETMKANPVPDPMAALKEINDHLEKGDHDPAIKQAFALGVASNLVGGDLNKAKDLLKMLPQLKGTDGKIKDSKTLAHEIASSFVDSIVDYDSLSAEQKETLAKIDERFTSKEEIAKSISYEAKHGLDGIDAQIQKLNSNLRSLAPQSKLHGYADSYSPVGDQKIYNLSAKQHADRVGKKEYTFYPSKENLHDQMRSGFVSQVHQETLGQVKAKYGPEAERLSELIRTAELVNPDSKGRVDIFEISMLQDVEKHSSELLAGQTDTSKQVSDQEMQAAKNAIVNNIVKGLDKLDLANVDQVAAYLADPASVDKSMELESALMQSEGLSANKEETRALASLISSQKDNLNQKLKDDLKGFLQKVSQPEGIDKEREFMSLLANTVSGQSQEAKAEAFEQVFSSLIPETVENKEMADIAVKTGADVLSRVDDKDLNQTLGKILDLKANIDKGGSPDSQVIADLLGNFEGEAVAVREILNNTLTNAKNSDGLPDQAKEFLNGLNDEQLHQLTTIAAASLSTMNADARKQFVDEAIKLSEKEGETSLKDAQKLIDTALSGLDLSEKTDFIARAMSLTSDKVDRHDPKIEAVASALANMQDQGGDAFVDTLAKLQEANSDPNLSDKDRDLASLGALIGGMQQHRDNFADDNTLKAQHEAVIKELVASSGMLPEGQADLYSDLAASMLVDYAPDKIGDLLDAASGFDEVDTSEFSEISGMATHLLDTAKDGLAHLKPDEMKPMARDIIHNVLTRADLAKEVGLDIVSREASDQLADSLLDVALNFKGDFTPALMSKSLRAASDLVTTVEPDLQYDLMAKAGSKALSAMGLDEKDASHLGSLGSDFVAAISGEDRGHIIDLASGLYGSDTREMMDLFDKSTELAEDLNLSGESVARAQAAIADSAIALMKEQAEKLGLDLDINKVATLLNPGAEHSLLDHEGKVSEATISALAKTVVNNFLDRPQSSEEHKLRNRAIREREGQHQATVKAIARGRATAMYSSLGPIMKWLGSGQYYGALADISGWRPGDEGGTRGVLSQMTNGYYGSKEEANLQMRKTAYDMAADQIRTDASALNDKEMNKVVSTLSAMLAARSTEEEQSKIVQEVKQIKTAEELKKYYGDKYDSSLLQKFNYYAVKTGSGKDTKEYLAYDNKTKPYSGAWASHDKPDGTKGATKISEDEENQIIEKIGQYQDELARASGGPTIRVDDFNHLKNIQSVAKELMPEPEVLASLMKTENAAEQEKLAEKEEKEAKEEQVKLVEDQQELKELMKNYFNYYRVRSSDQQTQMQRNNFYQMKGSDGRDKLVFERKDGQGSTQGSIDIQTGKSSHLNNQELDRLNEAKRRLFTL